MTKELAAWLQRADEDIAEAHLMLAEAGALLESVDVLLAGRESVTAKVTENEHDKVGRSTDVTE